MPTMNGRRARERMHEIAPDIPVVFVSGYVGDDIRTDFVTERGLDLISKPLTRRGLLRKIREVLDRQSRKWQPGPARPDRRAVGPPLGKPLHAPDRTMAQS